MAFISTSWNPEDKSSEITLSNGNLTASSTYFGWRGVRSVYSASSGKHYWEINCGSGTSDIKLGVCTADMSFTNPHYSPYGWGVYNYDGVRSWLYHDGMASSFYIPFAVGDVIGIALDLDSGEVYFAVNGVWINSGDPETNTNPSYSGLSGDFFAFVDLYPTYTEPVEYATANFGGSAFTYSVPSGYTSGFGADYIDLAESVFIEDSVDIGDEFITDSSGLISDEVLDERDHEFDKTVSDYLTASDSIECFNFTRWLEINYARAVQRFYFTLTGDADGVDDVEIPISSFQIRSSGTTRYISVEIPSIEYASAINLRTNGMMIVERAYVLDGLISLRDTIASALLDGIRIYEGGSSQSITLDGYATSTISGNTVSLQQIQTRQITNGALSSVRCAGLDFLIKPGDTCRNGVYEMIADTIIHTVSASNQGVDAYVDITAA